MEPRFNFTDKELNDAKKFFNRVNKINDDFVTFDSWGEKNDAILIGGDPSYSMVRDENGITVYRITHHYSYECGWEDVENDLESELSFPMALKMVALELTKDTIGNELMAMDHYDCYDEPEWDGACRCGSNEDNPCACD